MYNNILSFCSNLANSVVNPNTLAYYSDYTIDYNINYDTPDFFIFGNIFWGILIFIISISVCIAFGNATKKIVEDKGYSNGDSYFWLGFFLSWIGLIIAIIMPDKSHLAPTSTSNSSSTSNLSSLASQYEEERILSAGGWKCKRCGKLNLYHTGTCNCGNSKANNVALATKEIKEIKEKDEIENLSKLQKYKEFLDSGVITQEEFDLKKKELLK